MTFPHPVEDRRFREIFEEINHMENWQGRENPNSMKSTKLAGLLRVYYDPDSEEEIISRTFAITKDEVAAAFRDGYYTRRVIDNIVIILNLLEGSSAIERDNHQSMTVIQWRLSNSVAMQDSISALSLSLVNLHDAISRSNSFGRHGSWINPVQRSQIISMLESTIAAIKAPAVNAEQTSGFFSWLKNILRRGVEKQLDTEVAQAMSDVIDNSEAYLSGLNTQDVITNLDQLI